MSRTRRATVTAAMTYANLLLSVVVGIVLVPFVIRKVGPADYGLWQVVIELAGYLALTELGVFGVIPLRLAQADGRGDRPAARALLSNGLAFGLAAGTLAAVAAVLAGDALGLLPGVGPEQAAAGRGPLRLLLALTAGVVPLKVFAAVLAGVQDAFWGGLLRVLQTALALGLTVGLLLADAGLYALAAGAAAPPLVVGLLGAARARRVAPDLFRDWPRPRAGELAVLARDGFGFWVGGLGYGLMIASNGLLVLAATGRPELVASYVCLAKLPTLLHNLSRIPHESAAVGLAQLYAEGDVGRTRAAVKRLLSVQAGMTGGVVAAALMVNPAFASRWYPVEYAGDVTNLAVASAMLVLTLSYVATGQVSPIGHWFQLGFVMLANGVGYAALAVPAVRAAGLPGLAVALWLATLGTSVAVGARLHQRLHGLGWAGPGAVAGVWARFAPVWAVAGVAGVALRDAPVWQLAAAGLGVGAACVAALGPVTADLPVPGRVRVAFRWPRVVA